MLLDDARDQKLKAAMKSKTKQTHINLHFQSLEPGEKPKQYSDDLFKEAAIQWLIETDQPVQAFEHPAFKDMIKVAVLATQGVKIPDCRQTWEAIVQEFKNQMKKLKEQLK
ncbi:hypothetical protein BDZ94DRAFT_1218637 [Collybia nuda]|uniref:Uncharacterized protein n=1 Tax=Collybia nuda TaxID=64659 RepID=A0A9P5Y6F8_9AGAR|nr:hypothetical protein BDZ94DRAFT_1218637 [Collybia nuda]